MDGHTFLAAEPSHMEDGVPLHNHLAHHLREARTPPLTRPSSQHPIYSTAGPSYAEYPIHSYDSSLPTPVSGAGSPGSPEGTPEMHTIKHEPSSGIRNSPPLSSQAEWPYASTVTYPRHPHSPAALQNPHGFPSYDGLDTPDDSDNQHPGPTEAPFWPSPAMTTESIPYPMMVDMAQGGHNLHAPHHPQQNHHHHHHQSHDIYEQGHFHDSGSSVNMRGSTHPYPPFAHSQPGMVLEMNTATVGHSTSRPPRNRVSRTPKKSPGARRSRTKRPKARPRDEADDKSERFPKDPAERIKFDDDMKEQDRFLYNLRCELGSRNGEDMWDLIVRQYGEKYSPKQKACLQMQLKRAVTKHQVWPELERSLLADIMQDIVPIIRDELEERGGSSAMGFCDEQVLAQLVREGYVSIDPEVRSFDPEARQAKLVVPRSNKPRSNAKRGLIGQDQLAELTREQLDYIMESQAQSGPGSSGSESWQDAAPYAAYAGAHGSFASGAGQAMTSSAASVSMQDTTRSRQSYHIAAGNGSIARI